MSYNENPVVPNGPSSNTTFEIKTADPMALRFVIGEIVKNLLGSEKKAKSREFALAVTKLQEASFWLAEGVYKKE